MCAPKSALPVRTNAPTAIHELATWAQGEIPRQAFRLDLPCAVVVPSGDVPKRALVNEQNVDRQERPTLERTRPQGGASEVGAARTRRGDRADNRTLSGKSARPMCEKTLLLLLPRPVILRLALIPGNRAAL